MKKLSRRSFLQSMGMAGAGVALAGLRRSRACGPGVSR